MSTSPILSSRYFLMPLAGAALLTAGLAVPALAHDDAPHSQGQMMGLQGTANQGHMMEGHMMGGQEAGHDGDGHHHEFDAIGVPGKTADVTRTVMVSMHDNYFDPAKISVKAGETIRFKVINKGTLLHGFVLGTPAMHKDHQAEMMEMMDMGMITADHIDRARMMMPHGPGSKPMSHNDPNGVMLEPGKSGEVVWKFTKPMHLEFACDMPGHYESGMKGPVNVH